MLFRLLTRSQRFPNKVQLFSTRNLASLSKPRHVGPFPPGFLYNTFMKSTPIYVSCIFVGAIVGEYLWSNGFEMIWNYNNQGKLYKDIDFSKWNSLYLNMDDDDDDDDDDEDDSVDEDTSQDEGSSKDDDEEDE